MVEERKDSLDKHYEPIENLKVICEYLFGINALLSIVLFFLNNYQAVKDTVLLFFIITTILYFIFENYLSIYLIPNVEEKRRLHLLSDSFGVPLDNEETKNYYNNKLTPSFIKMGANILENSFIAKRVTLEMVLIERKKVVVYFVIWIAFSIYRGINIEFVSIVAQLFFASTIIPSWLKMEMLHRQNQRIYDKLYDLFFTYKRDETDKRVLPLIIDSFVKYEAAKAYSGVKQSTKIFMKLNNELSREWEQIKGNLNIE